MSRSGPIDIASMTSASAALLIALGVLHPDLYKWALHEPFPRSVSLAGVAGSLAFILFWQHCFFFLKLYDRFAILFSRTWAVFKGVVVVAIFAVCCDYLCTHQTPTARHTLRLFNLLFLYEIAREYLVNLAVDHFASRDPTRAIILGSGRQASKAWRAIRTYYHSSIKLLGFVDNRDPRELPPDVAHRYLGDISALNETLLREVVDVLLIAMPHRSCYPLMQQGIAAAENAGVEVIYLDDIYSTRQTRVSDSAETLFRELAPKQHDHLMRLLVKRALDVFAASVGLICLSPLLLFIGVLVRFTSKGPALYLQERHGFRRRKFYMLKFRSMVESADQLLPALESANEAAGPIFKIKNDPRITRLGRFLRLTSLDELPQLWNVLVGDMSLVGPRPMSVRDVSKFDEASLMRRFSVKPGITGLWQVSGRSNVGFDSWIKMDNTYIDNWSLLLDLRILARTAQTVLFRSGAM